MADTNRRSMDTLAKYTPCLNSTCVTALSMYSLVGLPAWIMNPSTNFIDFALCPLSFPDTITSQPLAPLSMMNRSTP